MKNLSILIPAYNKFNIIEKNIKNIFSSNLKNFEVIISDDSTCLITKQKIINLSYEYNFRYIKGKQCGAISNWNSLLSEANSVYIWLLHHDELIPLESLNLISETISNKMHDILILDCYIELENKKILRFRNNFIKYISLYSSNVLIANQIGSPSCFIFKNNKIIFDTALIWLVDVDFYKRNIALSDKIKLSRIKIISKYNNESITSKIIDINKMYKRELNYLGVHNTIKFIPFIFLSKLYSLYNKLMSN